MTVLHVNLVTMYLTILHFPVTVLNRPSIRIRSSASAISIDSPQFLSSIYNNIFDAHAGIPRTDASNDYVLYRAYRTFADENGYDISLVQQYLLPEHSQITYSEFCRLRRSMSLYFLNETLHTWLFKSSHMPRITHHLPCIAQY